MKIIGFGHRKRVGKDTAGNFLYVLLRLKGLKVEKKSLAWKLKQQCYELYYWAGLREPEYYEKFDEERELPLKIGKTPRQIWIEYGMAIREIYQDTWINYLMFNSSADYLIITDVRMENEIQAIKDNGGFAVKVSNPRVPYTPDPADTPLNHFNGWDHYINNDGSLKDLHKKVKEFADGNL